MAQVEASAIVEAERNELYSFTDWCYNLPEWFPAIRKAWIVRLPDADGLGKVTHYVGTMLGRDMEWEGRSVEWKADEVFRMRAFQGLPAKMNMQFRLQLEDAGAGKTRVTAVLAFRAPYPLIGRLIDRFYLRKGAQQLVDSAIGGVTEAAKRGRIPPISVQLERRKADHPGYVGGPGPARAPATGTPPPTPGAAAAI